MAENIWGILALDKTARRRASKDADQIEHQALQNGVAPFVSGLYDDTIADSLRDDYPVPDTTTHGPTDDAGAEEVRNLIAIEDVRKDTVIIQAVDELKRRVAILGSNYPFKLEASGLVYTGSTTLIYEFCLAVTQAHNLTTGSFAVLPRAFERLAGKIVQLWLGEGSLSLRTGWPPDEDRPTTFRETIQHLAKETGEWTWHPRDESYEKQSGGDAGLDLVVWRRPADLRTGGLTLLGQCACGNNWEEKYKDLDLKDLQDKYCRLPPAGQNRFFATPFHVSHEKIWKDASIGAGIVFDRTRITLIAEQETHCKEIIERAKMPYEDLIKIVVPAFRRLSSN